MLRVPFSLTALVSGFVVLGLVAPTMALTVLETAQPLDERAASLEGTIESGGRLPVRLPGVEDRVLLQPADPRSKVLAATAPEAARGLFTGHLDHLGWRLDLSEVDHEVLGVLADPAGARWVTLENGVLVPFMPPAIGPLPMTEPLRSKAGTELHTGSASTKDGVLQIRLDGDAAFYDAWGDQWLEVQLAIIHLVGAIYLANLGFPFEVVHQGIWYDEEEDPLDPQTVCGSGSLLAEYRNHLESESPTVESEWESSHLFSGRFFTGNTIGCAYIRQLDTSAAYAVSIVRQPTVSPSLHRHVVLVAHEIGHNFGGLHSLAIGVPAMGCLGATIMWANLCGNSPVFSGFEQVTTCRFDLPQCPVMHLGNAPRMWNYANQRI